jgi:hypothetical protein
MSIYRLLRVLLYTVWEGNLLRNGNTQGLSELLQFILIDNVLISDFTSIDFDFDVSKDTGVIHEYYTHMHSSWS